MDTVRSRWYRLVLPLLLVVVLWVGVRFLLADWTADAGPVSLPSSKPRAQSGGILVLAWNDLGMHCYNQSYQDLAVLPPYNTLWAQVIQVGDPPHVITQGITVTYVFTDNTYSILPKSNFWLYAQDLFGLTSPLTPNIGLTGKGLSGTLALHGDHFVADGIPLTEFRDSAPSAPYPYQLATVIVQDASTSQELARTVVVAPVSTEMHCEYCHDDNGVANEDIATGVVEQNILTIHDAEAGTTLMADRPVLCAECHASNALGISGDPALPSLSKAIHEEHADKVHSGLTGCYSCHPGPRTQCLRDVMAQRGMDCISCHGTMETVAANLNPWLNEPRCDNATCHGSEYAQDQALYRLSRAHGGIYCAGCHDSPHAIAPSSQNNDSLKFVTLQGYNGTLTDCTVCHSSLPESAGPHGILPFEIFLPIVLRAY